MAISPPGNPLEGIIAAGIDQPGNTWVAPFCGRSMIHRLVPIRQVLPLGCLCITALSLQGCFSRRSPQMIERNVFENTLKIGQILPLRNLVKVPHGLACVLYPYQDRVAENSKESARVNAYLRSLDYMGEEVSWSLLIVEPSRISISRFSTSPRLDILLWSRIHNESSAKLPNTFVEALDCFSLEVAAVTKIDGDKSSSGRIYLVFGEMK
jgi:hypothetical protein